MSKPFRINLNPWEGVAQRVRHSLDLTNEVLERYATVVDDLRDLIHNANALTISMRKKTELEIELLRDAGETKPARRRSTPRKKPATKPKS